MRPSTLLSYDKKFILVHVILHIGSLSDRLSTVVCYSGVQKYVSCFLHNPHGASLHHTVRHSNYFCYFSLKCYVHGMNEVFYAPPQTGAADAEIKVPSDENTELKGSPFKA